MRYLVIMPDYTGSCVREEFGEEVELEDLGLPRNVVDEIVIWHNSYREIIPLDEKEKKQRIDQIETLDTQGLKIAKQLKTLVPGGAKVKYFSEGKLKYLD